MSDNGWIKLYKSMKEWEWADDPNVLSLWVHILLNANRKPSRYHGYDIPVGSFVAGYPSLAQKTGLSLQQTRTALRKLESTGELTVNKNNKFSIISVVNWGHYQDDNSRNNRRSNSQITNNQQANNSQLTTEEEGKNQEGKNQESYSDEFKRFWEVYPKRKGNNPKEPARKKFNLAIKKGESADAIIEGVKKYAKEEKENINTPYIAQAQTWLNQERWKDYKDEKPAPVKKEMPPPEYHHWGD